LGRFSWCIINVDAVPPDSYNQVIVWIHHIHVFVGRIVETSRILEYNKMGGVLSGDYGNGTLYPNLNYSLTIERKWSINFFLSMSTIYSPSLSLSPQHTHPFHIPAGGSSLLLSHSPRSSELLGGGPRRSS